MAVPPPEIANTYAALLERAILNLRMRIRGGENVQLDEVHDLLDALHNVPTMLKDYGGWHVESNINADLARYDQRWLGQPGSAMRLPLVETLRLAQLGEFDK
jgi:hypothetical protein